MTNGVPRAALPFTVVVASVALLACTRPPAPVCFDILARDNSEATARLFTARHCQGGGVTWGALLAAAHGDSFTFDDEGDAVRVCGAPNSVDDVRRTYRRLNSDEGALREAMSSTSALLMECLEADGTQPKLPANMFPVPTER
jgi:hypothetical protein